MADMYLEQFQRIEKNQNLIALVFLAAVPSEFQITGTLINQSSGLYRQVKNYKRIFRE